MYLLYASRVDYVNQSLQSVNSEIGSTKSYQISIFLSTVYCPPSRIRPLADILSAGSDLPFRMPLRNLNITESYIGKLLLPFRLNF